MDFNINNYKLKEIEEYLYSLEADSDQIIKLEENKTQLFSIIFYFYLHFNKEIIQKMITNNKINKYI